MASDKSHKFRKELIHNQTAAELRFSHRLQRCLKENLNSSAQIAMPLRLQLSRKRGFKLISPNGLPIVKVDRSTKWGNPFIVGKHGAQPRCVDLYQKLMAGYLCLTTDNATAQTTARNYIEKHIDELRGKNLACWCRLPKPGEPDLCHAAVLLEIANGGAA